MSGENELLPELSDAKVARIERNVFREIDQNDGGNLSVPKRSRKRRPWLTALGVAAAFAVGAIVSPAFVAGMNTNQGESSDAAGYSGPSVQLDYGSMESAPVSIDAEGFVSGQMSTGGVAGSREMIVTSDITLEVADISDSVDAVTKVAQDAGGFVESTSVSGESQVFTGGDGWYATMGNWVQIRVPAADLDEVLIQLRDLGTVKTSSTSRSDVEDYASDLRARIAASEASVTRLTELMTQAGSVADLIAAETELTTRQAQLTSAQQELAALEGRVAMTSISVNLVERTTVTQADPDGFSDGLLAGWNGLMASLSALIIAAGFVLPWIAVAAIVTVIVWLIVRGRRSRRTRRQTANTISE